MDEPLSPTHFIVIFTDRKPAHFPIEQLSLLPSLIQQWGFSSIRKLIFTFEVKDRIQYPYGIHNLVLERSTKREKSFHVHFYHYHDTKNELITIPHEQQLMDFYTVLRLIYDNDQLAELIGSGVIDPFFKTNESGLLC